MTDSRHGFPFGLILGLIAVVVVAVILIAVYLPVAECQACAGGGTVAAIRNGPNNEDPCDECHGRGKVSLLSRWKQNKRLLGPPF